jgi:hypothetical protein
VHVLIVQRLAHLGDPDSLALLREVANVDVARNPDRVHDRLLAQAILNEIAMNNTPQSAPPTGQTPGVTPISVPDVVGRHEAGAPVADSISAEVQGVHHQLTDIAAELATVKHEIT